MASYHRFKVLGLPLPLEDTAFPENPFFRLLRYRYSKSKGHHVRELDYHFNLTFYNIENNSM